MGASQVLDTGGNTLPIGVGGTVGAGCDPHEMIAMTK